MAARPSTSPRRIRLFSMALLATVPLAACAPDRIVTGSLNHPDDFRARHPIVMTDTERTLDIFAGGGIGERQREDLAAFAQEYREGGRGGITAFVPAGGRHDISSHRGLEGIRAALGGVHLAVRTYPVQDPSVAAPIRLSFRKLGARVAHRCGQWPDDMSGVVGNRSFKNESYFNFGCATQQNLAAQVADPVDLVRPRTMERVDTIKRTRGLEDLRKAKDPSTVYQQQGQKINQGVGN